jgi:hypothetical protein
MRMDGDRPAGHRLPGQPRLADGDTGVRRCLGSTSIDRSCKGMKEFEVAGVEEHLESADYLQKRQLKSGTAGWLLLAGRCQLCHLG